MASLTPTGENSCETADAGIPFCNNSIAVVMLTNQDFADRVFEVPEEMPPFGDLVV